MGISQSDCKSVPNTGADAPGESYRLPHPPVYEAAGERIPVDHPRHQTGTTLAARALQTSNLLNELIFMSSSVGGSCLCLRRLSTQSQGWRHPLLPPTWALQGAQRLPPSLYTPHTCALSSSCLVTVPPTARWPCSTSTPAMKKRSVCEVPFRHKPTNNTLQCKKSNLPNNQKTDLITFLHAIMA